MINVAFAVYRQWGYDIFKEILRFQKTREDFQIKLLILPIEYQCKLSQSLHRNHDETPIVIIDPNDTEKLYTLLKQYNIDIICWYSWSWIVRKPIIHDFTNLCLHPSPLPQYRGGTPIQHQIINGEKDSAVSIFKMAEGIDDGPIYKQTAISFLGDVNDIFKRMVDVGVIMTKELLSDTANETLQFYTQRNLKKFPPNKRRTPTQSEIELEQLKDMTFEQLHNLVRGLLDPYPNAFIQLQDHILLIHEVIRYTILPPNATLLQGGTKLGKKPKRLFVTLQDGYAKITKYKIIRIEEKR